MNYLAFKTAKEKAFNAFLPNDIFYAFNDSQFFEGCEKIHAKIFWRDCVRNNRL